MDPQAFVRLSIGSLGLRNPVSPSKAAKGGFQESSQCQCEIKLRGFPVQSASVPVISSADGSPDRHSNPSVFYLEESDLETLLAPACFSRAQACLEITVFTGRQGSHCGMSSQRQQIGVFRLVVGPEWGEGKSILLHNGWTSIGKNKHEEGKPRPELHLRVKLDPDPRYVFQFEDEITLSPQIVQLQGNNRQPIFSCKFSRDRRPSSMDSSINYWASFDTNNDIDVERRERKGWKVVIHDLRGSAVAVAFMATPFVPATGSDHVAHSNPGAWIILHPDPLGPPESWHPWGKLEAWRESGAKDSICFRFHLLAAGQGAGFLVSERQISPDKGGEFDIDMDRQAPMGRPVPSQQINGEHASGLGGSMTGGFVMNCKVQGEGKSSKPFVQLALRHVTCVEDAAIFMALAAAVDLSILACRPFRRKTRRTSRHSF